MTEPINIKPGTLLSLLCKIKRPVVEGDLFRGEPVGNSWGNKWWAQDVYESLPEFMVCIDADDPKVIAAVESANELSKKVDTMGVIPPAQG